MFEIVKSRISAGFKEKVSTWISRLGHHRGDRARRRGPSRAFSSRTPTTPKPQHGDRQICLLVPNEDAKTMTCGFSTARSTVSAAARTPKKTEFTVDDIGLNHQSQRDPSG
jgi:hypothetical protein